VAVCCCSICFLGDRLLARYKIDNNETGELECNKLDSGPIYAMYCGHLHAEDRHLDPDCRYFHDHNVSLRAGIPGLASGMFFSKYRKGVLYFWRISYVLQAYIACIILFLYVLVL